ncbi:MAG: TonB-dependent receptor, partial [Alteraurantiacibacter sp.]|nr:TonB-dependent receptor [Alteraurantiacibacter sp.]
MNFRTALKGASAPIALSVALLAQPVLAQDADTAAEETEEDVAIPAARSDTIFVTGSRIRRDEFTAPAPLTVIDPEIASRQGLLSTGDIVQGSPIAAGSSQVTAALSSQFLVNGGQGVQTISLRGLGAERTLVMLNGRRAGPAGTRGTVSAFDLNVLPYSIVQTIDVLKDGASSIYGSDAVAGVVNIITKRDTDGVEFDFFGSVPQRTGGEQWSAAATWGKTFDRGHVLVSANYFRQNELERGDRPYLRCSESYVFTDINYETRADLVDPRTGRFSCNGAESNTTWGHVWTYDYSYYYSPTGSNIPGSAGDGSPILLQFSYPGDNLGNYLPEIGRPAGPGEIIVPEGWYSVGYDAVSRSVYNNYHPGMDRDSIIPTTDRYTIYLDAAYELADGFELYTELLYNKRKTYFDSSGQIWQFGVGITDELYGVFDPFANGFGGPALFSPTGFIDWYDSSQTVEYYRAVAGLRGDISSAWSYDIYGQYSKSDASYMNQRVLNDSIRTQDFRHNFNAPNGFRTDRCPGGRTPIGQKTCTFVDWYSARVMYGQFTAEEFDFLTDSEIGTTVYEQAYVEGILTGDLVELWAGTVGLAAGATYRRDEITDTPGPISQAGNVWQSGPAGVTAGYSETKEAFAEINIPLLEDLPLIQSLTFTGATRVTNVKAVRTADGASSTTNGNWTYKLQGNWEVTDWLTLRSTYGTSYRAPALFEQFLFDQVGSLPQRSLDPCIGWGGRLSRGEISQQFADNCAADGVPANHTGAGINGAVITGGGLGVLDPETSTAFTASVILQPQLAAFPDTRFSVAVDYFEITVKGQIAQFGAGNVVAGCYASEDFPNDPLCSLFARVGDLDPSNPYWNAGSPNNIAFVRDSFININSQKNAGVDVTARIIHDFPGDVTLTLQGQMTWQTKDTISVFNGFPRDLNGLAGEPKWVGDFNAELQAGPWTLNYGLDVIGATDNSRRFTANALRIDPQDVTQQQINNTLCVAPGRSVIYPGGVCYKLNIPATFYHNVSITREIGDNLRVTAGVSNLFDT